MAKQIFAANGVTGGTSGLLDDILSTSLEDGNLAVVIDTSANKTYFYKYSSSEAGAESSPDIIIPDDNSTGTGAWVLEGIHAAALTADSLQLGGSGAVPTEFSIDGTFAGNSDTAIPTEKAVKTYADALVAGVAGTPAGVIAPYGGAAAPSGWVLCDGSAIDRTAYATLFAIIGTSFGVGDGSTTFNVPDMADQFLRGVGGGDSVGDTAGADTKDLSHTHTGPSHRHTGPSHTHTGPSHTHGDGSLVSANHVHQWYNSSGSSVNDQSYNSGGTGVAFTNITTTKIKIQSADTPDAGLSTDYYTSSAGYAAVTGTTAAGGTGATGASGTANTGYSGTAATGSAGSATQDVVPAHTKVNYIIKT